MAFNNRYITSVYGKRLALQRQSTTVSGSGNTGSHPDFIVGAEDIRKRTSTAESTANFLPAYGVSVLENSSAGSSQVWFLNPPIPGVYKTIIFETTANTITVKTKNTEVIKSSQGTTMTALHSTQLQYAAVTLIPESTAAWAVLGSLSSGFIRASTTT